MARLTAPNGAIVSVADEKVENLVRHGFTVADEKQATAKPARGRKVAKLDEK